MESYWLVAQNNAKHAVSEAGVLPSPVARIVGYKDLIGPDATPTPMQKWAQEAQLLNGPALILIEDETGSGKTETALMLAHRLMVAGSAYGLYVALPTMATANAMFDRLAAAYRRLFKEDTNPSIALAHGARDMHAGFRAAMAWNRQKENPYSGSTSRDASDLTASAACTEWIADDRCRTFLADAGVGTIDQTLLAVLPNRHQSLRLLGLVQRVLILDEVHAYDAYMNRELERLLEFQAGLGGSAILLSATLPQSTKLRLTCAEAIPDDLKAAASAAKATWTSFDSDKVLVVLDEAGTKTGFGLAESGRQTHGVIRLSYNAHLGLGEVSTITG